MHTYRWSILDAGRLLLDGGGMFGVIPQVVWSRTVERDDKNRIELAHNCLLLQPTDGGMPILIEAGTGDKLDPKMVGVFGLTGRTIEAAVIEAGVSCDDIEAVVVSHLHFDHAGGLTRRVREGETPDWTATEKGEASGDSAEVKLTFPNAEIITQQVEWDDATSNRALMTRTYYPDHLKPLEAHSKVRCVETSPPFEPGAAVQRNDRPSTRLEDRMTEVRPGVFVFRVPGHTWGQQAVLFRGEDGQEVVFTPDVMPTAWHVGQAYSLSYDVEPYTSMVTKGWFLAEAAARDWILVLDHDPNTPVVRVRANDRGWYDLVPQTPSSTQA